MNQVHKRDDGVRYSICKAEGCDTQILPGTSLCPVHTALKQYETPPLQPDED